MPDNPNINLDRVGGTKQSAANVVDNPNQALRVNIVAGGGGGGGPATIADGADVAEGATTDAAVVSDSNGTLSGKLRGLVKILADVWDSVAHKLNVAISGSISNTTFASTQGTSPWVVSGAVTTSGTATVSGTVTAEQATAANLKAEVVGPTADNAVNPTAKVTTLPAVATAAQQGWTEGHVAPLSADLKGSQRIRIQDAAGNDRGANVNANNQLTCSVDNLVQTASNASIDGGNSSTTPLAAGAVFTGSATDMLNYSTVRVAVYSDAPSATGGWQVQFSEDGTNWDFARQTTYLAGIGGYVVFNRIARYMRVVYTNGPADQAIFRLQTLIAPNSPEFARHFMSEAMNDNNGVILTKAVISGKTGNTYTTARVTTTGALAVEPSDGQSPMDNPLYKLVAQLLYEQRICNMLLLKLSEPYRSQGWPNATDPNREVLQ